MKVEIKLTPAEQERLINFLNSTEKGIIYISQSVNSFGESTYVEDNFGNITEITDLDSF